MNAIATTYRKLRCRIDGVVYKLQRNNYARVLYPPRSLTITITGACIFKCLFCVNHSADARDSACADKLYNIPFRMELEEFKRVVDWARDGNIPAIHICAAGEPFLHNQVFEMIDYVIDKYGRVSIQTNLASGIFDDGRYLAMLVARAKHIDYITTDIISHDADVHNTVKSGSSLNDMIGYMKYLSSQGGIAFHVHQILTRRNSMGLVRLPELLVEHGIQFRLDIVNLHPYEFNEWTSMANVVMSHDDEVQRELEAVQKYCVERNIGVSVPAPFDAPRERCSVFWSRMQVIPVKSLPRDQWSGNVIPGYCNAVVKGQMSTLGNIFEYKNVMDFWNNDHLLEIRRKLISGVYPDKECKSCQNYAGRP